MPNSNQFVRVGPRLVQDDHGLMWQIDPVTVQVIGPPMWSLAELSRVEVDGHQWELGCNFDIARLHASGFRKQRLFEKLPIDKNDDELARINEDCCVRFFPYSSRTVSLSADAPCEGFDTKADISQVRCYLYFLRNQVSRSLAVVYAAPNALRALYCSLKEIANYVHDEPIRAEDGTRSRRWSLGGGYFRIVDNITNGHILLEYVIRYPL